MKLLIDPKTFLLHSRSEFQWLIGTTLLLLLLGLAAFIFLSLVYMVYPGNIPSDVTMIHGSLTMLGLLVLLFAAVLRVIEFSVRPTGPGVLTPVSLVIVTSIFGTLRPVFGVAILTISSRLASTTGTILSGGTDPASGQLWVDLLLDQHSIKAAMIIAAVPELCVAVLITIESARATVFRFQLNRVNLRGRHYPKERMPATLHLHLADVDAQDVYGDANELRPDHSSVMHREDIGKIKNGARIILQLSPLDKFDEELRGLTTAPVESILKFHTTLARHEPQGARFQSRLAHPAEYSTEGRRTLKRLELLCRVNAI